MHNYNNQAEALGRPHVTQFVVVDDRNLLSEEGGELLIGRFVRTDAHIGLTGEHVQQMAAVLTNTSTTTSSPSIPGLPVDPSEHRTSLVKHGEFGEVRLNMQSDPLPPTNGSTQVGPEAGSFRFFSCSLAFKDAWSGAPISCGDGTGRRPSPWIVAASPAQRNGRQGSKKIEENVELSTAEICGRLGGVKLDGTILGKGSFGIVYRGTWEGHLAAESTGPRMDGNKTVVAVKRAPAGEEIRREASLMSKLDHPHILKLLTSFDSAEEEGSQGKAVGRSGLDGELYLVLELCEGPDLQAILDARGALEEVECRRLIAQLASALCYLRTRSIIHRDVKPANCMLLNTLPDLRTSLLIEVHLKLLDFGFAKALGVSEASRHGGGSRFRRLAPRRRLAPWRRLESWR